MKKTILIVIALIFTSYNLRAQVSVTAGYSIRVDNNNNDPGVDYFRIFQGKGNDPFFRGSNQYVKFKADEILHYANDRFYLMSAKDVEMRIGDHRNTNAVFKVQIGHDQKNQVFKTSLSESVFHTNSFKLFGYKKTNSFFNVNEGTFNSNQSASFNIHIDTNSNDPNVDTFKIFQGTQKSKILDVGISYTKLFSRNFISENDGGFVVNIDKNNNSQVDKFKVLYGREKSEVLVAGKDDVTVHKKLITQKNIETKNIKAQDIIANNVVLNVGSFPDYVFSEDYELMPLKEVATYIKKNKHLPNMPSEAEVLTKGMDVKQINTVLVEKVEELTLHTILQEQKINTLLNELKEMKEHSEKIMKVLSKKLLSIEQQKN